ncbi:Bgt-5036 [Blumeria graminis f. sp. tritici]|uniref:Bgt-5036 n=2 Tax=Blumeria graminis f. sp. tritici TaxID=62690 RepID=A0A061HE11_BLUGR|nr:Zinc-ceiptaon ftctnr ription factor [Blumeria graminis f. sp. tritici 96224]VDB90359.1 Bgt-5036 [Blumeria graminis f. sp. tritici]
MDIKQIVNSKTKGAAAAVASMTNVKTQDLHLHSISHVHTISMSDTGSERDNSPHDSEHSRYSTPRYASHLTGINDNPKGMRYPSPTSIQHPVPMLQQSYRNENFESTIVPQNTINNDDGRRIKSIAQKAFPCSSCGKGFARRSDLARHGMPIKILETINSTNERKERIHSGVRPHVCEHPNCGKQFIQRSALTVHMRVHTGEKPHMCERCGKRFEFFGQASKNTLGTTLTRHQNHHTGTVEEAAVATAAALATLGGSTARGARGRSDGEPYSNNASPLSTPSPGKRALSVSPNSELAPISNLSHRQSTEFSYMNNSSLPGHLRGDYNLQNQPASAPNSFPNALQARPTSHPTGYGPPPVLEPPASNTTERRVGGSQNGSPHMSNESWQSPSHSVLSPSTSNGFVYPDPDPYGSGNINQQIYYPNSNIRRPGSSEPDSYEIRPRMNEMWTTAQ